MNEVRLEGIVSRIYRGNGGKGPFAFLSISPAGGRGFFDVSVFGDATAGVLDMEEGDTVRIIGRLGSKKDKKLSEAMKKDVWTTNVVVDGDGGTEIAKLDAKAQGDIAF